MQAQDYISLVGAVGIGGLIGVLFQSFFERRLSDKRMLFEARLKAYADITGLKEDALIFAKLNQLFSEAHLMASHDLADLLGSYKAKVFEFHVALSKKDKKLQDSLHKELVQLAGKIHDQMRRDLHIDQKSVFK